jgi:hypothetical protein
MIRTLGVVGATALTFSMVLLPTAESGCKSTDPAAVGGAGGTRPFGQDASSGLGGIGGAGGIGFGAGGTVSGTGGLASGGAGGIVGKGGTSGSSLDAGVCPAGQTWCPGCSPSSGSCGSVCPGLVCPVPVDSGCADASCRLDATTVDAPPACSQLASQTDCEARSDCHAVFIDPGNCACSAAGCCARYDHCSTGVPYCNGSVSCKTTTPHCEGAYVVSYSSGCYEGCVRQTACGPYATHCPQSPPTDGTTCRANNTVCTYQDCAGTGRTEAACDSYGLWKVQTMSCDAVKCAGGGITSNTLICDPGQICVRTTSGGGAYYITPSCVANTCSPAPLSLACLGLDSTCYVTSDNTVSCNEKSKCGSGQGGCQ